MDRISADGFIDIGGGKRGFRDENPDAGVEGTVVDALFMNGMQEEVVRSVERAGLAPADGVERLPEALVRSASCGIYYIDSGAANAHVLAIIGDYASPSAYFEGLRIAFLPVAPNNDAVTVNVAGLGVKKLLSAAGAALTPGVIKATRLVEAFYVPTADAGAGAFLLPAWTEAEQATFLRADKTSAQVITQGVVTSITAYNTSNLNFRDPATTFATGTLTIGTRDAGWWLCFAYAQMGVEAGTTLFSYVYKNGGPDISQANQRSSSGTAYSSSAVLTRLNAGDTANARVFHNHSTTEELDQFRFMAFRVGN